MTNGLGKIFTAYIENNKKYDYEIGLAVERMGLKSLNIIFEKQAADRIEKLEAALRDVYSEVKDEYGFALVEEKIIAALSWEKKDGSYNP